ncbi:DNRLRE domain-containing protein [Candidatus Blastococcus massiliensis]|uniref:DNRLRE domain-containing protein n=1 Tax=Candidatus Blastococcus massiliensis TaxID=1470358 RepID=UPI0004BBD6EE|nr:DNRLRE domain-containing protein [Candidatus Blastococcus massiliensis]
MSPRHGFSRVPKWRIKGVLGVALSGALLAEMVLAATGAQAAPAPAPQTQEEAARTSEGVLEAPDIATAKTIARLENERVEVIGERTVTSSTFALPDGTLIAGQAAGPIWVPKDSGDGTSSADWSAVDLTLVAAEDGTIRPKSHVVDLELAGEQGPEEGVLVSMRGAPGETVGLAWEGELPTPTLEGPRAVYRDVEPGLDLVVEATRTGYEQFFVVKERPDADTPLDLSLTVVGDGLTAAPLPDGGVQYTDGAGEVVGSTATPLAWDAAVDEERLNPVTQPWEAEAAPAGGLAPTPDWGTGSRDDEPSTAPSKPLPGVDAPPFPEPAAVPPLPRDSVVEPGEDAGQAASEEAAEAKASSALPLETAATVVTPGVVEMSLTPDVSFLQDPQTEYPVVVDPDLQWAYGFDTWVQHGFNTDQSGSPELRIGTFDGGWTVARSFINLDLSSIRHKTILNARLDLWNFHSWSCTGAEWQVWDTFAADHNTRIYAQPLWGQARAASSQTRGAAACEQGWVSADLTSMMQRWSNAGAGLVGLGLRATNESRNEGWKKFTSANSPYVVPSLWVRYNTPPGKADNLRVNGAQFDGTAFWTPTATPELQAQVHDADGMADVLFQLWDNGGGMIWEGWARGVPDLWPARVTVPAGKMQHGRAYNFIAHTWDGVEWNRAHSGFSPTIHVDTDKPPAPTVTSAKYPGDGKWYGGAGEAGTFTFSVSHPNVLGYKWGLNQTPNSAVGPGQVTITPPTQGRHVLQFVAVDKAGNESAVSKYGFNVGQAGLVTPTEGAQVVRRARLDVEYKPGFTHIKYAWRRGPDSAVQQDIALAALTRADGRAVTSAWTPITDIGDYATWDAGLTLGHVPGPVQVQAILAKDAQGSGAYATQWVTITVSPDAKNAATTDIGPGSVNLLTGDYTLSSTDVDEFGLAIGRAASSRDPKAGLEPMADKLTAEQQSMSAISGFTGGNATLSRATNRGHLGMDSLRIVPSGGNHDSFAQIAMPELRKGATYRVSGWIYVPEATGLSPDLGHLGLRMLPMWQDSNGHWKHAPTPKAERAGMWQQLSVDFTIPADAKSGGYVRLYNGFSTAGKEVFFDQLSVRELWAPFGPEWSLGVADEIAGTAYSHVSQPYPDVATLHLAGGGEVWFTASGDGRWWSEPGAEMLTLHSTGPGLWRLNELDGTVSTFAVQPGAANAALVTTAPPVASGQTRAIYRNENGRVRLHRLIAPVEPGVGECNQDVPSAGCEVAELLYGTGAAASATTFGSFSDRVSEVRLWSSPSGGMEPTSAVTAVKYAYDDSGRLRQAWDPRISPALTTSYEYDADGRITKLSPPGEFPWKFQYGTGGSRASVGAGDLIDRSSGRLLRVSRPSLVPGTNDQAGDDIASTMVYNVPLTRAAGGPHDLDATTFSTWAQRTAPTDATAVFGPEDYALDGPTTASASTPGKDGYRRATIHYLDSSAREVNTATPSGPNAPLAGYIDTAEYDEYGNVVRSLDATNRLLALGQMPSADADLNMLGLAGATISTASRAMSLSTLNTYSYDGLDLLRTRGPLVRLAVGNDPGNVQNVHDVSMYAYDEGKPDGFAYHLVTTQTEALLIAGTSPEQLVDIEVTKTGYHPIDGQSPIGPSSGWKHGQPTVTTFDATGASPLSAYVRYDAQGKAVESRGIGANGQDARTNLAVYYTAGPNPQQHECGNKPGYAGLPCMNYVAGAVAGHDPARMAGQLPVKHVTGYNRYGSIASVTESATGPVAGATTTQSRTTVTEYDDADRVLSVAITASGVGAGVPVSKTVNRYDKTTGDVTVIEAQDPTTGAVTSTIRKTFDQLGRMTRYEDGNGGKTTTVFDKFGKPKTVTDDTGSTQFDYNRDEEPRGFVTKVTDSVGGEIWATYGPDGQVTKQSLPGGVELRIGYDANRTPITRAYVRTSDDEIISQSSALENSSGQMVTHTTNAASKRYIYDALGRLTTAQDNIAGTSLCAARTYGYDARGNRSSLATAVSDTGTCVDPANPGGVAVTTNSYVYDSADRLLSESAIDGGPWVYDPLGRITTAPVRGSPGRSVANAYYANDLIASQTIEEVARQTWSLDAIGRFASYTNEAWAVGGDGVAGWQEAVTKVNHYDSDSDSPAWIAEDASLDSEVTRYVDGLDGNLAMETGKDGGRILQLIDLRGNVMSTLPIPDDESAVDIAAVRHQTADEFGNPTNLNTGGRIFTDGQAPGKEGRYGWLGGRQRSADALAGVLLMGVRLYDPATGRFWSRDPQPGGNSTAYDYCSGDPVNCTDLDGQWGVFKKLAKKVAKKVAKVAEVVATVVPGPIGAAAGAISAGAYAASGNKRKALEMGVVAAAAMIPGGGAAAKAGFAAARAGGRVASRIGQAAAKPFRRAPTTCRLPAPNSFTPETGVLMADGSTIAISDVEVGDLVAARDPLTGEVSAQPVLNVIVGNGAKHLIDVVTAPAPSDVLRDGQVADDELLVDGWTATSNHPIWVEGHGWTDAEDLAVGDLLQGVTGELRIVKAVDSRGWLPNQTVYNLGVANVHTFVVGQAGDGTLVHNCSPGAPFTRAGKRGVREDNIQRHGELRCERCGIQTPRATKLSRGDKKNMRTSEIDHIVPRSKGGTNARSNGQNLCARCNNIKGAR